MIGCVVLGTDELPFAKWRLVFDGLKEMHKRCHQAAPHTYTLAAAAANTAHAQTRGCA